MTDQGDFDEHYILDNIYNSLNIFLEKQVITVVTNKAKNLMSMKFSCRGSSL